MSAQQLPLLSALKGSLWDVPDADRPVAAARLVLILPGLQQIERGVSVRRATRWLHTCYLEHLGISESSVNRWINAYLQKGIQGLAPIKRQRQIEV